MSDVSSDTVLSTGTTTARTLASRGADNLNVKDYGAVLNGTTSDYGPFNHAYQAAADNGTIVIPGGNFYTGGVFPNTTGKTVNWHLLSTLDYSTSTPGTNPVGSLGDGDLLAGYWAGRYNMAKTITTNTAGGFAVLELSLTNNTSNFAGEVCSNLSVQGQSTTAAGAGTWNVVSNIYSGATSRGAAGDIGIFSQIYRSGATATWLYSGANNDLTGLPPNAAGAMIGMELDNICNGPEATAVAYAPILRRRSFINLDVQTSPVSSWQATTSYALGAVVADNTNTYTAICTGAGTSGGTIPTFPTSNGIFTISGATWASGLVTFTTSAAYQTGMTAGQTFFVQITGCTPSGYNISSINEAPIYATVVNSTTFTVPLAANPGLITVFGSAQIAAIVDGSVVWSFGTTIACEIGTGIYFGTNSGSSAVLGTGISSNVTYYNAAIDLSFSAFESRHGSKPAAIRLGSGQIIDFTGNQFLTGQNLHTLQYVSASASLQYQVTGTSVFTITDGGNTDTLESYSVADTKVVGAQISGYGTPSGNSKISSFPGASATLAQCSEMIAQIITDLKAHGLLGV